MQNNRYQKSKTPPQASSFWIEDFVLCFFFATLLCFALFAKFFFALPTLLWPGLTTTTTQLVHIHIKYRKYAHRMQNFCAKSLSFDYFSLSLPYNFVPFPSFAFSFIIQLQNHFASVLLLFHLYLFLFSAFTIRFFFSICICFKYYLVCCRIFTQQWQPYVWNKRIKWIYSFCSIFCPATCLFKCIKYSANASIVRRVFIVGCLVFSISI